MAARDASARQGLQGETDGAGVIRGEGAEGVGCHRFGGAGAEVAGRASRGAVRAGVRGGDHCGQNRTKKEQLQCWRRMAAKGLEPQVCFHVAAAGICNSKQVVSKPSVIRSALAQSCMT